MVFLVPSEVPPTAGDPPARVPFYFNAQTGVGSFAKPRGGSDGGGGGGDGGGGGGGMAGEVDMVDGDEAPAVAAGGHLCLSQPVGCGANGAPRQLRVLPRA